VEVGRPISNLQPVVAQFSSFGNIQTGQPRKKGRSLLNSVSGEEARLEQVMPLVAEYETAVIGLVMDNECFHHALITLTPKLSA